MSRKTRNLIAARHLDNSGLALRRGLTAYRRGNGPDFNPIGGKCQESGSTFKQISVDNYVTKLRS